MRRDTYSLEAIVERGLGLPLGPLQRAICRAADGAAHGLDPEAATAYFGTAEPLPRPAIVCVVAGVRSGKSILAGGVALRSALVADLGPTRPHEIPRAVVVGPSLDNAGQTFSLLRGALVSGPLASLIVEETSESILISRPHDGRIVELAVVAASRGAIKVRSRWLVAAVLEEAALFGVEATGSVVNAEELLRAAEPHILPGGQIAVISSPYGREGLLFDLYRDGFGKPSPRLLVVHAPTVAMNPAFDRERIEALRRTHPDVAAREYDATWLDADTSFLDSASITRAQREAPEALPPSSTHHYVAAIDPATRGNAWPLVVGHREGDRVVIDLAVQWVGSKSSPLSPRSVLAELASLVKPYRVTSLLSDRWAIDALADLATDVGLSLCEVRRTPEETVSRWLDLRALLGAGLLELPPDPVVRSDLAALRRRVSAGGMRVELPLTSDGRHADFAAAILLVVAELDFASTGVQASGERPMLAQLQRSPSWGGGEREAAPFPRHVACDDGVRVAFTTTAPRQPRIVPQIRGGGF